MTIDADFEKIRNRIIESNINASKNRNMYPIQEQATLEEIWEYSPCECDGSCACKKIGCKNHWMLKNNITFNDIVPAFLRMFVDIGLHERLQGWMNGNLRIPEIIPTRARGVLPIMIDMRNNWDKLYSEALNHKKTLLCSDWHNDYLKAQWDFPVRGTSVYEAKKFCILMPDICIPYDTFSRNSILSSIDNADTYYEMLYKLRECVIGILDSEKENLDKFRKLDSPQEQLKFDRNMISLKTKYDYGSGYAPIERPITRIVDKYFYQPNISKESEIYKVIQSPIVSDRQILLPLSGSGQRISWKKYEGGRIVYWGKMRFNLHDELIDDILDNYFKGSDSWYPLGASMTDPVSGGFGEFLQKYYKSLTPRHASAIASIMVQDDLIEFRGKKPIELKKIRVD